MKVGQIIYYTDAPRGERHYVYALCDPRDDTVRYIGSTPSPQRRLTAHVQALTSNGNGPRLRLWIADLVSAGQYPYMKILTIEKSRAEAIRIEWQEIKRRGRASLLNGPVLIAPAGLFTIHQVAEHMGISRQRVHQLLEKARIMPKRTDGRTAVITTAQLQRLLKRRRR